MKKILIIILIVAAIFITFKFVYKSETPNLSTDSADLILFWGNGCPHCEVVKKYITDNSLDNKIKISQKEVYYDKNNQKLLEETVKKCPDVDTSQGIGVPLAFVPETQKCLLGDTPIIDWLKTK
jgi:glutaredoxin